MLTRLKLNYDRFMDVGTHSDYNWVFKLKKIPDGLIKKFTAQLCACGDKKLELVKKIKI